MWSDFQSLPHYQNGLFPQWEVSRLRGMLKEVANTTELNLLEKCLQYNPLQRISAKEALQHEYFANYAYPVEEEITIYHHPGAI